jgi:hypothetical protein
MCAQRWDSSSRTNRPAGRTAGASTQTSARDADVQNIHGDNAHEELERLAGTLRQVTLDVAWRQWRVLGAGAATRTGAGRPLRALIDPEALVLVSLALLDEERRLADLLHDWAARNADLLSVQRMKNLAAGYPDSARDVLAQRLAWFATVAHDVGKDLRWRPMAAMGRAVRPSAAEPTDANVGVDTSVVDVPSVRAGARSGTKVRATRARLTADAALLLRLRLGVGVGVKADVLAFLLARSGQWATVRELAEATAYTPAAVRRAAEDLAAARLTDALDGAPMSYRTVYAAWAPLLALEDRPPHWARWHERFVFVIEFLHWANAARARPLSAYVLGAHGRELLGRHRPAFERDVVAVGSAQAATTDDAAVLIRAVDGLARGMQETA